VSVLDDQDERPLLGEPLKENKEALEEMRPRLARGHTARVGIAGFCEGQRRAVGRDSRAVAGQFRQQLRQLPRGLSVSGKQAGDLTRSGFPYEVTQHRGERAVRQPVGAKLQARPGQYPDPGVPRGRREFGDQPGFAHPGFAANEQGGRITLADRVERALQGVHLGCPPDKDGAASTPAHHNVKRRTWV
jgi:hypothetical protein